MIGRILIVVTALCLTASTASAFHAPRVRGFVPNDGQWPSEVLYLYRTDNLHTWITKTGLVVDQFAIQEGQRTGHVLKLTWDHVGSLTPIDVIAGESVGTHVSFFHGRDERGHQTALDAVGSVRFQGLYPGVDLIYYLDDQGQLRYDFDVAPGALVGKMGFTVEGDHGMEIRPDAVLLKTTMGGVNMTDLYAYVLGKRSMQTQAVFSANE